MLNPQELKDTALQKRRTRQLEAQGQSTTANFTQEQADSYVSDLEKTVLEFASDGHLQVEYLFNNIPDSLPLMHAVAHTFKHKHPLLMVITNDGNQSITVTWDGLNNV